MVGPLCQQCGRPISEGAVRCPACGRRPLPLPIRSFAYYQPPLTRGLWQLKYRPNRQLAAIMAAWLEPVYRRAGWSATMIVPVPLGRARLRKRGFNQAELLARPLAGTLGLPVVPRALRRPRETRSQVGLGYQQRATNVAGAFTADGRLVADESVLLIDDLCTTGSTLAECARALLASRARAVFGLTVARAR